ncbi:hypothetical protein [Mesorhizobium sp. M0520]|uniref:hypothetical protein n=1 Tax=Mesorhizobium sp. M0520 TaxID=2956957 RepID=UPI0033393400
MDLHLTIGPAGSDHRHHFGVIASILEDVISPSGGPFILVLWTEHPQLRDELRVYLDVNITEARSYARPIDVVAIDKTTFIDLANGTVRQGAPSLQVALQDALTSNHQLTALLGWETEVVKAAGNTLASLLDLVPATHRTSAEYPGALDRIMSHLAAAATGASNAALNPRTAINATLAPILADRVVNQDPSAGSEALWRAAVTHAGDADLGKPTPAQAAQINGMLHLAHAGSEAIAPTDWGAVVDFPFAWSDIETQRLFGVTTLVLQNDEFRAIPAKWADCTVRLVRIGASCDYAQNKPGPLTFLLGVEMPQDAISNSKRNSGPASEWRSPFLIKGPNGVVRDLAVNCRYIVAVPRSQCAAWIARYRLREGILTELVNHDANYMSRPGIIRL